MERLTKIRACDRFNNRNLNLKKRKLRFFSDEIPFQPTNNFWEPSNLIMFRVVCCLDSVAFFSDLLES